MSARQRRFWWAAGILGAVVAGVSVLYFWATDTVSGRRWVLATIVTSVDNLFEGRATLRVGALRQVGWRRIQLDSVTLLDTAGVPVLYVARVEGSLDVPALLDTQVRLRFLELTDMRLAMRRDFSGPWNLAYIISGPPKAAPLISGVPGYGDNITIAELRITRGEITTTMPWEPNAVFTGAARDSVISVRDSLHDLTAVGDRYLEDRRIVIDRLVAHDGKITRPFGALSSMEVDSLAGIISDPPVRIVGLNGRLEWTPDSLRLTLPRVQLPASVGSAEGRVWWNQPGPVRYDVTVKADATFSDLVWIWDVLPPTGRGTATVRLRTLENADDAEYALSDLDISAGASHVTGRIHVTTRPAVLELDSVAMEFAPIEASLLRRLSYDVLPETVKGMVTGTLVAERGGPLDNLVIDRINARFADATIPGAVSLLRASGTVSIGVEPAVRGVRLDTVLADLRSVAALMVGQPTLDGIVAGSGRIVSADLRQADARDVRLRWIDAVGNTSFVRGDIRVGYGLRVPTVVAALELAPISFQALARIDTALAIRSNISGTVAMSGSLDSLAWKASLAPDSSSRVVAEGMGAWRDNRWRIDATGTAEAFNARAWLGRTDIPVTALSGPVAVRASGTVDSAAIMHVADARSTVSLRQQEGENRPAFDIVGSLRLDSTHLQVDSATVHIGGMTLDAVGRLARRGILLDSTTGNAARAFVAVDTMEVSASADSLHQVRRQLTRLASMIEPVDTAGAESLRAFAADSLRGNASVSGYLVGSLDDFNATLALGARNVQMAAIHMGRVFGSLRAENVLTRPSFEGVVTTDDVEGIGAIRIASSEFKVQRASPDSGQLVFDARSADESQLMIRGGYARHDGGMIVVADSLQFKYDSVTWKNAGPIRVRRDSSGVLVDSLEIRSTEEGVFTLTANVPVSGDVQATVNLERFPVGEATAFALGTKQYSGLLRGDIRLEGTRQSPLLSWRIDADSLGLEGTHLPRVLSRGDYADKKLVARALIADSVGGELRADVRVPVDLTIGSVEKRLLSDDVDADIVADSLRLETLGIGVSGATRIKGRLDGRLAVAGTMDRPVATGRMELSGLSAFFPEWGVEPGDGHAVVRAVQDSLILETFRIRSGPVGDTLGIVGALRFAVNDPMTMRATATANNFVAARQRNGTDLVVSGRVEVVGPVLRPDISGTLFIPRATLVINPLGASTALDLRAPSVLEYLSPSEIPVALGAPSSMAAFGQYASVSNLRVSLGNEVWVRTPEATLKLSGAVGLTTFGDELVLEGEVQANRGQYRLDLGVVSRSFTVDTGRVRFYGDPAIQPTLDISATNVVRLATGDEIPVGVHVGGTIERPSLRLSSTDPLYSAAPESEIISLLIFGAPTFALDGQSQSTVRAVTGVLLPSVGGAVEGVLQQLLPVFNTVQVTNAGGQSGDNLNAYSLLDNLSISAGKQIGDRTYLRLNTGVCRGANQAADRGASVWYGVATEYRIGRGFSGQVGVDPGSAPCSRLGAEAFPRMQFGFDLFKEWIF